MDRLPRAIHRLPDKEREVFGLIFCHALAQTAVAALLRVHARTVRRRWRAACLTLSAALGDQLPEL